MCYTTNGDNEYGKYKWDFEDLRWQERRDAIAFLIEELHWSYTLVGSIWNISRQRVHQLYKGYVQPCRKGTTLTQRLAPYKNSPRKSKYMREDDEDDLPSLVDYLGIEIINEEEYENRDISGSK